MPGPGEILITMLADDAAVEAVLFGETQKASDRNCSVMRIGKQPIAAICDAAQILAATDLTWGRGLGLFRLWTGSV